MRLRSSITEVNEAKPARITAGRAAERQEAVLPKASIETDHPIVARAVEVFGDLPHAQVWLSKPNECFGHRAPAEMLRTEAGRLQVREMLGQIDEGMFT
jgi:uncharacterized protein (DUF2384 family)